jgi:cytoskeletal protein CcmA (bactofilin family)
MFNDLLKKRDEQTDLEGDPGADPIPSLQPGTRDNVGTKSTVICEGFEFKGKIKFAGVLNLDGNFDGEMDVQELVVGPNGKIMGEVRCTTLTVRGNFDGKAHCKQFTVGSTGRVNAEISYRSMQVAPGAILAGKLTIG